MGKETILCSLVAIPARHAFAREVIERLAPQCERVIVYANEGFSHPLAEVRHRDALHDQWKFDVDLAGVDYHLTCDDDLAYPADYVARLVEAVKRHNHRRIVGVHGAVIRPPVTHYYRDRHLWHYRHALAQEQKVQIIGTGTLCYSPRTITFPQSVFETPNLADIYAALHAQAHKIGASIVAREAGWLDDLPGSQTKSLYSEGLKDPALATQLANRIEWNTY